MLCPVLCRLDFWGELIDLVGLAVLLSHDLSDDLKPLKWLEKAVLYLRPRIAVTRNLVLEMKDAVSKFEKSAPSVFSPWILQQLEGDTAARFLDLFPDWSHTHKAPSSIDVYVVNRGQSVYLVEPWLYARRGGAPNSDSEPLLVGLAPAFAILDRGEKRVQNSFYKTGFLMMAAGSLLAIASIISGQR
jgi:hypothetical protein